MPGQEPVAALGKQHAARSGIEWDVRDIDHPQLGPIKFAVQREAIASTSPSGRLLSQTYVSCQKGSGKIAIELVNASEADPAGGLRPMNLPRLDCNAPAPRGAAGLAKSVIPAKWEISPLGDSLARGLSPADLRRCVFVDVHQSVALPAGSFQKSQSIALEIPPYDKELDAVFAACGEKSAFAPAEPARAAAPLMPQAAPAPAPKAAASAQAAPAAWKAARTTPKGRTNVRASASIDAPVVVMLDPGARILVQPAAAPWWEVKPRSGKPFQGFIRQDRFTFE